MSDDTPQASGAGPEREPGPAVPPPGDPSLIQASLASSRQEDDEFAPLPEDTGWSKVLSTLLQQPGRIVGTLHDSPRAGALVATCTAATVVALVGYGLLVGSFSGGTQWWAAPLKITLGALVAVVICLPSLYVFACLSNASESLSLGRLWGTMLAALTIEGLLLVSFAPVAWIFSQSTESVVFISILHLLFWSIAMFFAMRLLLVAGRYLGIDQGGYLRVWMLIFVVVNLQMMTAVRPLVGRAETLLPTEKKFFLAHWIDTFRVEVQSDDARHREPRR